MGITLQRYPLSSGGGGGDWIDARSGAIYAGASPPSSALFDAGWAAFLALLMNRLRDQHITRSPSIRRIRKGLTPAQQTTLQQTINGLTPAEKAKIIRLP